MLNGIKMSKRGKDEKTERRWHGLIVSEGVAVGRVLRLHAGSRYVFRASLNENEIAREVRRLHTAVRLARRQLLSIKRRAERALGADHAYVFDAHLLMLEDRKLLGEIEEYVRREHANAEWAVKVVTDRLLAAYATIKDEYLRARHTDIEDVSRRLLVALNEAAKKAANNGRAEGARTRIKGGVQMGAAAVVDAVIVAEELLPSAAAELDFTNVRAIATDIGGWTSHTAIIARAMGIPSIVGLRDFYRQARTGDVVIVDARAGEIVLHPTADTFARFQNWRDDAERRRDVNQRKENSEAAAETASRQTHTSDGVEIVLRANIELPFEYTSVKKFGARGVGLYRSEFLLTNAATLPSEDEQCAAYVEVARLGGEDGAKVRLFDLGGDKINPLFGTEHETLLDGSEAHNSERNPALGLRAIRFCLQRTDVLRTQARAALRAAAQAKIELVLPLISDIAEVRRARKLIEEERVNLQREGYEVGVLAIGAMIEVPSAVMLAEKLAREVDFFSLGTNDLVQYLLAVDRNNDDVSNWFRTLHPAVLHSIKRTLDAARSARIPVNVCGEMAGTPAYAFILIGLGARELSMTPSSIPRVRRIVAQIDVKSAQRIAEECLECATADEAEEVVRRKLTEQFPYVFASEKLPAPK